MFFVSSRPGLICLLPPPHTPTPPASHLWPLPLPARGPPSCPVLSAHPYPSRGRCQNCGLGPCLLPPACPEHQSPSPFFVLCASTGCAGYSPRLADPVLIPHPRPAPWGPTPRAPHSPEPAQPSLCLDPMDQSCLGSCLPSVCDLLMGRDNSMLHPFQMWKLRLGEQVHHPVLHRSSPAPSFRTQHECSLFSEAALTTPSNVALLLPHPHILPPCTLISFPLGLCLLLYRGNTWEPRAPILVPTVPWGSQQSLPASAPNQSQHPWLCPCPRGPSCLRRSLHPDSNSECSPQPARTRIPALPLSS